MNPVYLRLLEVARELGEQDPIPNTYFQELLDLSSGRISQICDPLSVAKLGPKGLSRLANKGYSPSWINDGVLPKRLTDKTPNEKILPLPKKQRPEIMEAIKLMEATDDAGRIKALEGIKWALKDHQISRKHRAN